MKQNGIAISKAVQKNGFIIFKIFFENKDPEIHPTINI